MFHFSRVVLYRSQPMFHYWQRIKRRRYSKLPFTSHSEAFLDPDPSSNANDLRRPQPSNTDTTTNSGEFKRSESVSVESRLTDVTFRVPLRNSKADRVILLGDSLEFGKRRRKNAFPLKWTPGNVWNGQLRLQPDTYEFKIIRVRDGKEDRETGENRVLVIEDRPSVGVEMEVTMEFGKTHCSNTIKTIRETVVLGPNGDELYRVPGELHKLKQTPKEHTSIKHTPVERTSVERTSVANLVAEYFKSVLELHENDIELLFHQRPSLRFMSIDLEVKPWVEYLLQKVSSSYSWVGALIKRNPKILDVPVEKLAPVVEFLLYDAGVPIEKLRRFLERSRTWHYQCFEKKFKPRIENLRQITRLNNSDLGRMLTGDIGSLSLHETELEQHFEDLRFRLNLGKKEFADLIARCPRLLFTKPNLVYKKLEYLTKELNRSVDEIIAFPSALVYNSDEKIKERFEYLERIGIPHSAYNLYQILCPSNEGFECMVQSHLES